MRAAAKQVTSSQGAAQRPAQGPSLAEPPYTLLTLCSCTPTSPAAMQGSQRRPETLLAVVPGSVQRQLSPCRCNLDTRPYPMHSSLLPALLVQLHSSVMCGNAHVAPTPLISSGHLAWHSCTAKSSACRVSAGVPTQSQGLQPLRPVSWRSRPRLPASASRCLPPNTWRTYTAEDVLRPASRPSDCLMEGQLMQPRGGLKYGQQGERAGKAALPFDSIQSTGSMHSVSSLQQSMAC